MTADELRTVVTEHKARMCPHGDCGALLDLLTALAQPVPYRPGLPTAEQIQAHAARGGWWQVNWLGSNDPDLVKSGTGKWQVIGLFDMVRPCLTDGTPCAWPGEPDPCAALEALR